MKRISIIACVISFIIGMTIQAEDTKQYLPYDVELIVAYNDYYNHCEELLDSVAVWDETFLDTTMETDTYYSYEVSKERVDSLMTLEM